MKRCEDMTELEMTAYDNVMRENYTKYDGYWYTSPLWKLLDGLWEAEVKKLEQERNLTSAK